MSFQNIVFLTADLWSLSDLLKTLEFREYVSGQSPALLLYHQNQLFLTVRGPQTPGEEKALSRHGTSIHEVWIASKEDKSLWDQDLGVTIRCSPMAAIKAYFTSHFPDLALTDSTAPLTHLDHIALNIRQESAPRVLKTLQAALGLVPLRPHTITGARTSFTCHAFQIPGQEAFIVVNTSSDPASQICSFIDRHQGPGVQHLAFHTPNLEQTIPDFKRREVPFVAIPPAYYESLVTAGLPPQEAHALQRANLLLERSPLYGGFLKQTFTKDLIGPCFFEFIHRHQVQGFGEKNITALFKAVEAAA